MHALSTRSGRRRQDPRSLFRDQRANLRAVVGWQPSGPPHRKPTSLCSCRTDPATQSTVPAGFTYIRGTGARDRVMLMTAERLAGAAIALQLACWYLINLRTLKVRIDVNDLSSEYTEEAYTYYYFGCVVNLFAMVSTGPSLPSSLG